MARRSGHFVGSKRSDDGFASVDALAALSILAITITLAIGAATGARRASAAGLEAAKARTTLSGLMNSAVPPPGLYSGRTPEFSWRMEVAKVEKAGAPVELCRRRAEARSLRSTRRYVYETHVVCREGQAS